MQWPLLLFRPILWVLGRSYKNNYKANPEQSTPCSPAPPPRPNLRWLRHLTLELKCTVSVTQEALRTTKCISVHQRKMVWCRRQRVLYILLGCLAWLACLRTVAGLGFNYPACAFPVPRVSHSQSQGPPLRVPRVQPHVL